MLLVNSLHTGLTEAPLPGGPAAALGSPQPRWLYPGRNRALTNRKNNREHPGVSYGALLSTKHVRVPVSFGFWSLIPPPARQSARGRLHAGVKAEKNMAFLPRSSEARADRWCRRPGSDSREVGEGWRVRGGTSWG